MALSWPSKDPDEVLDYELDWTARLADDEISSSNWILPIGISKNSDSHDEAICTVWLSSGTDGQTYTLTNRIVTAGGRTMDQSVKLKVKVK